MNRCATRVGSLVMARALVVIGLSLAGCAGSQASSGPTIAPASGPGVPRADMPEGEPMGGSADELHLRRRELSAELMSTLAAVQRDAERCEEACSLSVSICSIQERLCEIADAHAGSDYYQRLCREAKLDCRNAQEVCATCAKRHMDDVGPEPVEPREEPPADVAPNPAPDTPPSAEAPATRPPDSR